MLNDIVPGGESVVESEKFYAKALNFISSLNRTELKYVISLAETYVKDAYCMSQVGDRLCTNKIYKNEHCKRHYEMFLEEKGND